MKVLQLTAHFSPNVGGVETHLDDLVTELVKQKIDVTVLTYRPLTTKANWKIFEDRKNLSIIRIPWIAGFFYTLVNKPILEFVYLFPGLFFITPLVIVAKKTTVIHAHGLVAGVVGVLWGKLLRKRVVVSTHSIYHFPTRGMYHRVVKWLFSNASCVLTLSQQSKAEVVKIGIPEKKVQVFTYWVDQDIFKPLPDAKKKLGWDKKFVVLFVGRLIEEKGINELLESSKRWDPSIFLAIAGTGPLQGIVEENARSSKNLIYAGRLGQKQLPLYYSAADMLIVPSVHEEGFGRVILEALFCGTPVIGSNRGAIPEAIDETVGKLVDVTPENIVQWVNYFSSHTEMLLKLKSKTRKFAEERYTNKNVEVIVKSYQS